MVIGAFVLRSCRWVCRWMCRGVCRWVCRGVCRGVCKWICKWVCRVVVYFLPGNGLSNTCVPENANPKACVPKAALRTGTDRH